MARNAIESELRTSKMTDGSHFVKHFPKNKVAYRSEMARNAMKVNFRHPKWAPVYREILHPCEIVYPLFDLREVLGPKQ